MALRDLRQRRGFTSTQQIRHSLRAERESKELLREAWHSACFVPNQGETTSFGGTHARATTRSIDFVGSDGRRSVFIRTICLPGARTRARDAKTNCSNGYDETEFGRAGSATDAEHG